MPITRHDTTLLGYTAWLELDDTILTASYNNAEALLAEMTDVIREAEDADGYHLPAETEINSALYGRYFEALVTWVAQETGYDVSALAGAWHPDVPEPYLRYRLPETQYREVPILPVPWGFDEWQLGEANGDAWVSDSDLLHEAHGALADDEALYELGVDCLPDDVPDIRGHIRNEPPRVFVTTRQGPVYHDASYWGIVER